MAGDETALEVVEGSVELDGPVRNRSLFHTSDPEEVLAAAKHVARALKQELDAADMVMTVAGRPGYVKAEGWQTLAAMLGLTVRISWTRPLEDGSGSVARAEVLRSDGTVIGAAEAMCSSNERNWARRDAFAKLSMAQTRATTKALRTVLAFVMTLSGHEATPAEEMATQAHEPEPALPEWARPAANQDALEKVEALLVVVNASDPQKQAQTVCRRAYDRAGGAIPQILAQTIDHLRVLLLADRQEASP